MHTLLLALVTHSTWNHVGRFNINASDNPLHKYSFVPTDIEFDYCFDVLINSAKYLSKVFDLVDTHYKIEIDIEDPYDFWLRNFEILKSNIASGST